MLFRSLTWLLTEKMVETHFSETLRSVLWSQISHITMFTVEDKRIVYWTCSSPPVQSSHWYEPLVGFQVRYDRNKGRRRANTRPTWRVQNRKRSIESCLSEIEIKTSLFTLIYDRRFHRNFYRCWHFFLILTSVICHCLGRYVVTMFCDGCDISFSRWKGYFEK